MAEQGVGEQLGRVDALVPEMMEPMHLQITYMRNPGKNVYAEDTVEQECHFFQIENGVMGLKITLYRVMGGTMFHYASYMGVVRYRMWR